MSIYNIYLLYYIYKYIYTIYIYIYIPRGHFGSSHVGTRPCTARWLRDPTRYGVRGEVAAPRRRSGGALRLRRLA